MFLAYRSPPPVPFPRQPSEFRSAAALETVESAARAALDKRPDDIDALLQLVVAGFERGPDRYEEALKNLEKARDLGALDDRIFYYAGALYEAKGVPEFAAPEYEKFLRRHPDDLETRLRLGNLYYRLEELDKSAEAYRRVLAKKPGDTLVSFNLAFVLRDRKNWTEALEALKPFTEGGRALPTGGRKLLGDIYRGLEDPRRALDHYQAELVAGGDSPELAAAMAAAFEDNGEPDAAAERWQRVLQFDPKNREARGRLRRLKTRLPG